MATALISDSQKNTIKSIIDDIHETFARTITVFKEGKKVLIDVDRQLSLNGFTGGNVNLNGVYLKQSATFYKQVNGSAVIERDDTAAGTESDPTIIDYFWKIIPGNTTSSVANSNTLSRSDSSPTILQPYQMTWSGLTLLEIVKGQRFNGIYGRNVSGKKTTTKTVVQHTLKARIKYIDAKEQNLADGNINSQLDIDLIDGSVRITVDSDGFEILKEAKRCEFEGRKYTISTKGNPTGIFGPQYYHFYLSPIEE